MKTVIPCDPFFVIPYIFCIGMDNIYIYIFVTAYLITSFVIAYLITSFEITYLIELFVITYLIKSFVTAFQIFASKIY